MVLSIREPLNFSHFVFILFVVLRKVGFTPAIALLCVGFIRIISVAEVSDIRDSVHLSYIMRTQIYTRSYSRFTILKHTDDIDRSGLIYDIVTCRVLFQNFTN